MNEEIFFGYRHVRPQRPKDPAVKLALKLTTLKMSQLIRRQKQFARKASTAKFLLAKMAPGKSRMKFAVEETQRDMLSALGQATAEIKARNLAAQGRLEAV